ncbi:hypothetical protein MKX01_028725, partial [Papaver californicum]
MDISMLCICHYLKCYVVFYCLLCVQTLKMTMSLETTDKRMSQMRISKRTQLCRK